MLRKKKKNFDMQEFEEFLLYFDKDTFDRVQVGQSIIQIRKR